jgi:hypothetical protein
MLSYCREMAALCSEISSSAGYQRCNTAPQALIEERDVGIRIYAVRAGTVRLADAA